MKVGAIQGGNDLEAIREPVNGRHIVVDLGQANRSYLATSWTAKLFVPMISHRAFLSGHPMTAAGSPMFKIEQLQKFQKGPTLKFKRDHSP
jgi:hypothetical protein